MSTTLTQGTNVVIFDVFLHFKKQKITFRQSEFLDFEKYNFYISKNKDCRIFASPLYASVLIRKNV